MMIYRCFLFAIPIVVSLGFARDDFKLKLTECPEPVQATLKAETGGARIETVSKETDDDGETTFWVDLLLGGKPYSIGVLADGTLSEMTLGVDADDIPFEKLPPAVQATFKNEGYGQKLESVGKEIKYGMPVYATVVTHKGKKYELVVAEDGTLVEKVLVIDDEEVDFAKCPAAVQSTFTKHAGGTVIHDVTRYTGISKPTYEAEVEIKGKVFMIEVAESGLLISKTLEADVEE